LDVGPSCGQTERWTFGVNRHGSADGGKRGSVVRVDADEKIKTFVSQSVTLFSSIFRMTLCSFQRATKMAMCRGANGTELLSEGVAWLGSVESVLPDIAC